MNRIILGRTGLEVSVLGLGAGGDSRLGAGRSAEADSLRLVRAAIERGVNLVDTAEEEGLDGLLEGEDAASIPDVAYRFCRDEPGARVILSGTSSVEHLLENVRSIEGPPLSERARARLVKAFAEVDDGSGR